MDLILCALLLVSPKRPPEKVGQIVTKLNVYRTDKTEHCFEEVTKVGRTWWDDETLWLREVDSERCVDLY